MARLGRAVPRRGRRLGTASIPVAALVDNFNDDTVDTVRWPSSYGTFSETGGVASVASLTTLSGYGSQAIYALAGSSVSARVTPPSVGTATSAFAGIGVYASTAYSDLLRVYVDPALNVTGWRYVSAGSTVWSGTVAYSASAHAWLRIRESAGTVFVEASPDGVNWSNLSSQATPAVFAVSATCEVDLEAKRDAGTGTNATFDDLNITPTAGSATATLGGLSATAVGLRTVGAAAASSLGALSATVAGKRATTGTAAANLGGLSGTVAGVAATPTASLVDRFTGGTVDSGRWPHSYGTVSQSGGRAVVDPASGLGSTDTLTLVGSSVHVQVFPPDPTGASSAYASLSSYSPGYAELLLFAVDPAFGALVWRYTVDSGATEVLFDTVPYDAQAHAWLRISESGGTLTLAAAPDGLTWSTITTFAIPAPLAGPVEVDLECGRDGGTGAAEFDNINVTPVTGTAAAALGGLTATAAGASGATVTGTTASVLGGLTAAAAGTRATAGVVTVALGALGGAASGIPTVRGVVVCSLGGLSAAAAGTKTVGGVTAAGLGALTVTASGVRTASGVVVCGLAGLTASASGTRTSPATAATSLGGLTATAAGTRRTTGTAVSALGGLTATAAGTRRTTGSTTSGLGGLSVAVSGTRTAAGAVTAALGALVVAAAGSRAGSASAAATLGRLTAAVAGTRTTTGTVVATLGGLSVAVSGTRRTTGSAATALGGLAVAVTGRRTAAGVVSAPLGALTAAASGGVVLVGGLYPGGYPGNYPLPGTITGAVSAGLGGLTAAASGVGFAENEGVAATGLGGLGVAVSGHVTVPGAAAAALGALTAAVSGVRATTGAASTGLGGLTCAVSGVRRTTGTAQVVLGRLIATGEGVGFSLGAGSSAAGLGGLTVTARGVWSIFPGRFWRDLQAIMAERVPAELLAAELADCPRDGHRLLNGHCGFCGYRLDDARAPAGGGDWGGLGAIMYERGPAERPAYVDPAWGPDG